ncbi:hypothetical protein FE257_005555 [Aspergillus nanangensis]|uniref:Uncharacterized protein n=1 Tax=Aspergillus nanangensis TaxID=2582783 RepID=A0AAD4CQ63_ASPNN|nr:hypothetical protein FE257_005555 [Aspergillus nanangensis]
MSSAERQNAILRHILQASGVTNACPYCCHGYSTFSNLKAHFKKEGLKEVKSGKQRNQGVEKNESVHMGLYLHQPWVNSEFFEKAMQARVARREMSTDSSIYGIDFICRNHGMRLPPRRLLPNPGYLVSAEIRGIIPHIDNWLDGTLPLPKEDNGNGLVVPSVVVYKPLQQIKDLVYNGPTTSTVIRTYKETKSPPNFSKAVYTVLREPEVIREEPDVSREKPDVSRKKPDAFIGDLKIKVGQSCWVEDQTTLSPGLIIGIWQPAQLRTGARPERQNALLRLILQASGTKKACPCCCHGYSTFENLKTHFKREGEKEASSEGKGHQGEKETECIHTDLDRYSDRKDNRPFMEVYQKAMQAPIDSKDVPIQSSCFGIDFISRNHGMMAPPRLLHDPNGSVSAKICKIIPQMDNWLNGTLLLSRDNGDGLVVPSVVFDEALQPIKDLIFNGPTTNTVIRTYKETKSPPNFSKAVYTVLREEPGAFIGDLKIKVGQSCWVEDQTTVSPGLIIGIWKPAELLLGF